MSFPRLRELQWDESAGNNSVTVPFGHIWRFRFFHIKYIADANVATRTVSLQFSISGGPQESDIFSTTIDENQTEHYFVGFVPVTYNLTVIINQPVTLFGPTDTLKLNVVSEQAGDLWDVWGSIEDWVGPRA